MPADRAQLIAVAPITQHYAAREELGPDLVELAHDSGAVTLDDM
jgi:hypothetical protein